MIACKQWSGRELCETRMTRIMARSVTRAYGQAALPHVKGDRPLVSWMVRHNAWIIDRYVVRKNSRTAFEELKMVRYQSPLVNFAECVLARRSGIPDNRLSSSWVLGLWLGRRKQTHEHIIGTPAGIEKARAIKRRAPAEQFEL